MTLADKLIDINKQHDPLQIALSRIVETPKGLELRDSYTAWFTPYAINQLHITEHADYNENNGAGIFISHEGAIELAKFLKRVFLDEDPTP
jgi:hypothetical protein